MAIKRVKPLSMSDALGLCVAGWADNPTHLYFDSCDENVARLLVKTSEVVDIIQTFMSAHSDTLVAVYKTLRMADSKLQLMIPPRTNASTEDKIQSDILKIVETIHSAVVRNDDLRIRLGKHWLSVAVVLFKDELDPHTVETIRIAAKRLNALAKTIELREIATIS